MSLCLWRPALAKTPVAGRCCIKHDLDGSFVLEGVFVDEVADFCCEGGEGRGIHDPPACTVWVRSDGQEQEDGNWTTRERCRNTDYW